MIREFFSYNLLIRTTANVIAPKIISGNSISNNSVVFNLTQIKIDNIAINR